MSTNKITKYSTTDGGKENPCELVSAFMLFEQEGGTLSSWLEQFDFDTREEIHGAQASHCSGFSCGAWALGCSGFTSCSSQALEHRLNSLGTQA